VFVCVVCVCGVCVCVWCVCGVCVCVVCVFMCVCVYVCVCGVCVCVYVCVCVCGVWNSTHPLQYITPLQITYPTIKNLANWCCLI